MNPGASRIRDAMQAVAELRRSRAENPALTVACLEVKRFQAQRFQKTYADLLDSPRYKAAARFFLDELYGDKDYAQRDLQFSRIADSISRVFPRAVVETASALAEVHALTEQLDDMMAQAWLAAPMSDPAPKYVHCWRAVARRTERTYQLEVVLHLGEELDRLTGTRGLRSLLKMMRLPAATAGLGALQRVLESGFDAFANMKGAAEFLSAIESREVLWMNALFDEDAVACETRLRQLLAQNTSH